MRFFVLIVITLALGACSGPQQAFDLETLGKYVAVEGDIQCTGEGIVTVTIPLPDFGQDAKPEITLKGRIFGLARAFGTVDATGEGEGAGCAGLGADLGPFRWLYVTDSEACDLAPGFSSGPVK